MKLLVIDIQKGIANDGLFNYNNFINDTNKVINAARENNIEVIYVQHDDGPKSNCSIGNEEFEISEKAKTIIQRYYMEYDYNRGILDFMYNLDKKRGEE